MDWAAWWQGLKEPKKRERVAPVLSGGGPSEPGLSAGPGVTGGPATVEGNPILYHDGLYTTHLLRVVRLSLVGAGILAGAFIGAVAWNISLYPLKEKVTEYIVFGDGQYMHIEKGQINTDTLSLLVDDELKKYVEFRETIDHTTEKKRFDWVRAHTDPKWFKPWADFMAATNPNSPLEKYRRDEKKRNVFVNSLLKTSTRDEFQAEMTFIDRSFGGSEFGRSEWVVVFKAVRRNVSGAAEMARLNGLGVIVTNYDAKPRTRADADKARGGQ